jgi:uncharacterized protein (TIGR02217 family)
MAHLDTYLDRCPDFGWQGAPRFNTLIVPLKNKRTRRNAEWSRPEWRFNVPFNNNAPEHYQQVLDTFLVCRGRTHAFRVRNWLQYQATAQQFATGDGTTSEFQLGRLISIAGETYTDAVYALSQEDDAPTPEATVDGVVAAATFNDRLGKVLFDVAPALGTVLRWTGYYDFWVRFAADDLPYTIEETDGAEFFISGQAELEETEPPDEEAFP